MILLRLKAFSIAIAVDEVPVLAVVSSKLSPDETTFPPESASAVVLLSTVMSWFASISLSTVYTLAAVAVDDSSTLEISLSAPSLDSISSETSLALAELTVSVAESVPPVVRLVPL